MALLQNIWCLFLGIKRAAGSLQRSGIESDLQKDLRRLEAMELL